MTDLALFKASAGTAVLEPVLFSNVRLVEGVELLTQRLLALLLRDYDAVFERGTALMAQLRGGALSGPAMKSLVSLAVAQAAQQLPTGATPAETLSGVRVVSVTKNLDHIMISLEVTARSAQTTTTTTAVRTA